MNWRVNSSTHAAGFSSANNFMGPESGGVQSIGVKKNTNWISDGRITLKSRSMNNDLANKYAGSNNPTPTSNEIGRSIKSLNEILEPLIRKTKRTTVKLCA
jgi:hypothetical protein